MKKILVTGADGFIGTRLVNRLKQLGFEVRTHCVDDGDITEADFSHLDIDHVFHLAARTFVPASWENPYDFYRVNVMGTANVLELCRKKSISLTFPSTYVYGQPQSVPVSEDHPLNPNSPYNHSKVLCENLCGFYHQSFGLDIVVLRPFNIYGAGQNESFLIPTIIRQALDPMVKEIVVKDLVPKRDYVYVDDLIEAMCLTIGKTGFHTFNVASGISYSVEEVIQSVLKIAGISKPYSSEGVVRTNEVNDIVADIGRIEKELGWMPKHAWEQGLAQMIGSMK